MSTMDDPIPGKQLPLLALIGLGILLLFAVGFLWLTEGVLGDGEGERFLALAPFWVYPYLLVNSLYIGLFATRFAKGKWKYTWIWGIAGFAMTLLSILVLPGLLAPFFPGQNPVLFAGPAIFAFLAPILSAGLIILAISIRKPPAVNVAEIIRSEDQKNEQ